MKLTDLHVTPLLQVREGGLNAEAVTDYAAAARRGDTFPALIAYRITDRKFPKPALVAGFHRHKAFTQAGLTECEVELRTGTFAEAWLAAWTSNLKNAVRYTNLDKRRATETALKLFRGDSAPVIAERIGVSDEYVRKVRKGLVTVGVLESEEKVKGRDGKPYPPTIQQPQGPTVGPLVATKPPNKPAPPVPAVGTDHKPEAGRVLAVGPSCDAQPRSGRSQVTSSSGTEPDDEPERGTSAPTLCSRAEQTAAARRDTGAAVASAITGSQHTTPASRPVPKPSFGQQLAAVRDGARRLNGRQVLAPDARAARVWLLEETARELLAAADRLRTQT